jgi:hypothetical protein
LDNHLPAALVLAPDTIQREQAHELNGFCHLSLSLSLSLRS